MYEYISDKTNAQKSRISIKIDVYSYRIAQRRAFVVLGYSAGIIAQ
jgi:hypothetical protein